MNKKFRVSARRFFLTFSNLTQDIQLEDFLTRIKAIPDIQGAIVSKEFHKSGIPHFHALIIFSKKKTFYNSNIFDHIINHHPQISSVKSLPAAIKYIKKDGHFLEWGQISKQKTSPNDIRRQICAFLKQEQHSPELLFDLKSDHIEHTMYMDAGKVNHFYKQFKAYQFFLKHKNMKKFHSFNIDFLKSQSQHPSFGIYIQELLPILQLINTHANQRHYKAPNLHLWSFEPSLGKSSLMNFLAQHAPTYTWPHDSWYQFYASNLYHFILWDEFTLRAQQPEFIKLLFAGNPMQLPIKGAQVIKNDNPLIISASNHSLIDLVKIKFAASCSCKWHELHSQNVLCFHPQSSQCNTTKSSVSFYNALKERIISIQIKKPLFPAKDGSLHTQFSEFLSSAVFYEPNSYNECTSKPTTPKN